MEVAYRLKMLRKMLGELGGGWIFVEGKKDREALSKLGISRVLTISGNLVLSCGRLKAEGAETVYVLTDLDRRGDELALRAKGELESCSIRADLEMRKRLGHMLRIRCFEDAFRAFEKIEEEAQKE